MSNTETVKAIYEAFGRGDVATILDKLDDAVEWDTTVPVSDVICGSSTRPAKSSNTIT